MGVFLSSGALLGALAKAVGRSLGTVGKMSSGHYQVLAEQLARLIMEIGEGDDKAYSDADDLVQMYFPDIYEEYS